MGYGQRLGQSEILTEWIVSFNAELRTSLYFGDHMAPFRELLRSLKDKTARERGATVSALIKGIFYSFTLWSVSFVYRKFFSSSCCGYWPHFYSRHSSALWSCH